MVCARASRSGGVSSVVDFGILGPVRAVRDGREVELGGPRRRALLALLLVAGGRVVPAERLAEELWASCPPPAAAGTLRAHVSRLRTLLSPEAVLVARGGGYALAVEPGLLDAARFERLAGAGREALETGAAAGAADRFREALGLWRGRALADVAEVESLAREGARLEELRLVAIEGRIEADLALGLAAQVAGELDGLVAEYPLRERLWRLLVLALYRAGRQADALAAYRRARDLLAEELGIEPGEPLRRLHQSVLAQDPALDWNGARPAVAEDCRADADMRAVPAVPEPPHRPTAGDGGVRGWGRRHVRSLLAVGSALAAAAALVIVAVARPWAGEATGLAANSVGLIGPAGGSLGKPVMVGSPAGLAYGDGSVWAVDNTEDTLSRINPASHAVVQTIPVGSAPTAVTATRGNVWVTNSGDGTVSRINAAVNAVVQTIPVGNLPVAIASGPSGVWVANEGDDTVDRIDPVTGDVTRRNVPVGGRPDGIAVGPGAVWVANSEDGTVTRVDPATGQPSGPISVGSGPAGIAVTPAAVWVANSLDLTVSKLDPATDTVTGTIDVGDGPSAVVAANNAIWVSDEFNATLDRIDPRTGQVARTIPLGSSPRGLAAAGPGVWVAAQPFAAASHRGGTVTVVSPHLPKPDPALAFDPFTPPALAPVYDGLVAFRRAGYAAGLTLVPDLATRLPRPADGGRTYAFTLRRGIRYSTGTLVRASDFRRGIQRMLSLDPPTYYQGILGAQACRRRPPRCDLSAGIVTNDAAGTVTFHLSQPDPDFLYKLALLLPTPAPPGAPSHPITRAPFLPGTGPYMISQYRPGKSFTLVRNPHFRQWSYAAQPAGYPDMIRYEQIADPQKQQSAVAAGTADLVILDNATQSLAIRYPNRIHPGLKLDTIYAFLNTRQPPFTNIKARQAVNYAIDRAGLLRLYHFAPGQAAVTCQILPADFPAHESYCPYTAGPKDGAWHGPDLAKAVTLARQSGTTNVPVTVWSYVSPFPAKASSYFVRLLRELGYRAHLHVVSLPRFFTAAGNSHNKIQIGWGGGWNADFPAPSTFFLPLLSCRSFYQSPTQTSNWAGFCDPRVDQLASKAQAAQLTDPAAARKLWAQVDRAVTNQAPLVPVYNETSAAFVSARAGNYQSSPAYGPLLDQMWVR